MYMSAIGLARNTEEQKAVQEVIWSAILDDRLARGDPLSTLNTYFVRLRDMAAVEAPARPPCPLGSLLAPPSSEATTTAAASSSATAVLSPPQLFPSLNIPSVHCVKEEAGGPHLVKLEAGVEACGGEHKALYNSFLAIKAEPTEDGVTNGDLKRRLEAPLLNDGQLLSPPKRRPQHHQQSQHQQQQQHHKQLQQQQQHQQGGEEGRVFAWPGIQAIEMAYKTYKEGAFPLSFVPTVSFALGNPACKNFLGSELTIAVDQLSK